MEAPVAREPVLLSTRRSRHRYSRGRESPGFVVRAEAVAETNHGGHGEQGVSEGSVNDLPEVMIRSAVITRHSFTASWTETMDGAAPRGDAERRLVRPRQQTPPQWPD